MTISNGGTIPASELKKIKISSDDVGLRTYDPGWVLGALDVARVHTLEHNWQACPFINAASAVSYNFQACKYPKRKDVLHGVDVEVA